MPYPNPIRLHGGGPRNTFHPPETQTITQTARLLKAWGGINWAGSLVESGLALGVLLVLVLGRVRSSWVPWATASLVALTLAALRHGVVGSLYINAGRALALAATPSHHQVRELLSALRRLGAAFTTEAIVLTLCTLVGVLLAVASLGLLL